MLVPEQEGVGSTGSTAAGTAEELEMLDWRREGSDGDVGLF